MLQNISNQPYVIQTINHKLNEYDVLVNENDNQNKKVKLSRNTKAMRRNASIHHEIIKDKSIKLNQKIKKLFESESYPKFSLKQFQYNESKSKQKQNKNKNKNINIEDQRIISMLRELEQWNKSIDENRQFHNKKCQYSRNKFIYSELKKIIQKNKVGSESYQIRLNKLYDFYLKNIEMSYLTSFQTQKKTNQDEDDEWKVRKTFKTNNSLEINNYVRKMIFVEPQELQNNKALYQFVINNRKNLIYDPSNTNTDLNKQQQTKKYIETITERQNITRNINLRLQRQLSQINLNRKHFTLRKSKLQGQTIQRINLHKNHLQFPKSASTSIFYPNKQEKSLKIDRQTNKLNFKQNIQLEKDKIKKYRLHNTFLRKLNSRKKFNFSRQTCQLISPHSLMSQKNINLTEKQPIQHKNPLYDVKEHEKQFFIEFSEIKNWGGLGLMQISNEKKPIKLKKTVKK